MKSVLISIKPKWCELIANGKKTVEVRKTNPKLETPFKCYIYCTKSGDGNLFKRSGNKFLGYHYEPIQGKVIGEFVCDVIYETELIEERQTVARHYPRPWWYNGADDCLHHTELENYLQGKTGYGWHISNLVIYDKPRELSEFYVVAENADCEKCKYYDTPCESEPCNQCQGGRKYLTRPPQSWCYVESEVEAE